MKTTKENFDTVSKIAALAKEWADYVNSFGNECAYTDSILEKIQEEAKKL